MQSVPVQHQVSDRPLPATILARAVRRPAKAARKQACAEHLEGPLVRELAGALRAGDVDRAVAVLNATIPAELKVDAAQAPSFPFKRRQRVIVSAAMGPLTEAATIVRPDRSWAGWFIVRFDVDGARLCVHGANLTAVP